MRHDFHYFCKKFDNLNKIMKINASLTRKIILAFVLIIPIFGMSQVDIKITIDNQQDSIYHLYKYRGSKTTIIDTLVPEKSIIRIKSKDEFPQGIYLLTNDNNLPLIEILIGKDQSFSLTINDLEDLNSAKVKGGKETEIYFKLMAKVRQYDMNIAALENEKGYFPNNYKKIDSLKKDLSAFEESMKIKKKDAFINVFINSLKRHGLKDYWDDFQLNDGRILTYPLIDNKLETYFKYIPIDSDTINKAIDYLISRAGDCIEVRDYLIWHFYRTYYSPNYMNLDDVYIHLVDKYFLKLELENVSESIINLMADRANYLENLKLGAKIPEIGNLYSVNAQYIALVFYDETCQKCAQEGRILEEIRMRHPEMTIFPVEVHSGIKENLLSLYDIQTTPMIYLLDNQKKIIAKRIKAGQVEQYLNMD